MSNVAGLLESSHISTVTEADPIGASPAELVAKRQAQHIEDLVSAEIGERFSGEGRFTEAASYVGDVLPDDSLGLSARTSLVKASRRAYYRLPLGRNAIESTRLFVCGGGVSVKADDEDPNTQAYVKVISKAIRIKRFVNEMVRRALRDGEDYIHKSMNTVKRAPRFVYLDPLGFKPPPGVTPGGPESGIQTDPLDVGEVLMYHFDTGSGQGDHVFDPEEIHHIKIFADSDMLHGRPMLEPVLKRLAQYDQWVDQRAVLNRVKTAVYMIRYVSGGQAAVSRVTDKALSSRPGRTGYQMLPPTATVITASDNVRYEMLSPNLDARDVSEDGRKLALDVAAGIGMPLPLLTGDVSETTYNGLLVAESPFVRKAQDLQGFFGDELAELYEWALDQAIELGILTPTYKKRTLTEASQLAIVQAEAGLNGADDVAAAAEQEIRRIEADPASYSTEEVQRITTVEVIWPEIIRRDLKATVAAAQGLSTMALASRTTLAGMVGLDYAKETHRMVREARPDRASEVDRLALELVGDESEAGTDGE